MSRLLRRFAIVGSAFALAGSAFTGTGAATAAADARTVPIQLLGINDLHGNLEPPTGSSGRVIDESGATVEAGGAAYLAAHLKRLREPNSIRVAAGDSIGATPLLSAAYHDEPTIELLNHVGLDYSSVGNHEFDEGYDELLRIAEGGCHPVDGCSPEGEYTGADFPFLAANVIRDSDGETAFPAFTVKNVKGARVGFIGVVTKTTPSIVTAEGVKGLTFIDEIEATDKAVAQLRKRGVKAIVLVVHEGDQVTAGARPDSCQVVAGGPGTRIAKGVSSEVDVVMTGHSHQPYNCTVTDPAGEPRVVMQGGSFGRFISEVTFSYDRRTRDVVRSSVRGDNHVVTRTVTPDADVVAMIDKWRRLVEPVANRPIGEITADITRTPDAEGETPLGNLIADAQLADTKAPDAGGAQVALMNPGGVRADLTFAASGSEGDGVVTYGEAFTVQPFNNIMGTVSLTGEKLDALLEQQWQGNTTRILQPSASLHYTITPTNPQGSRVSDITIDGTPVDPATTYRVAANNFLLGGGDGFTVFEEFGTDLTPGRLDIDAFESYLTANSPAAPPPTNRITTG